MCARGFARLLSTSVLLVTLLGVAGCKEEGGVKVTSMTFNGLKAVQPNQLKSVLATNASSKLPWGEKRYFSREQFEADLKRIVAFYHDRGYPDARVASFDVKLSEDQGSVAITLNIEEGQPLVAERIELDGFDVLPSAPRSRLERMLPIKPGQPMDRALIQASREAGLDQLKNHGYPYATVRVTEESGSSERQRVLSITADTGPLTRHGELGIQGNSSVSDQVIRRQLTFRRGDIFSQSKLLESQRNLYALEVFQFANIEAVREEGEKPLEIPTRITVTEGKHRKVNFSLGYGSEERARVEGDWRHVNFFGGARTAGVHARYSRLDRGVRLNFLQPYFFSRQYSFGLQGQYWHNDEPAFTMNNVGGRATITREIGRARRTALERRPTTTVSFTYANEWEDYEVSEETLADPSTWDDLIALGIDPRTGSGRGRRSSISLDGGRNTTNNVLDARRGYVAALHLEQSGKWLGGDFDYYELNGELRHYVAVANRVVLAVRARGGSIDGIGTTTPESVNVPFYKLYFLGGATNLRGWGRFDVAPLSEGGTPIGGQTFANFSAEVRLPIWRNLSGVLFADAGNVWTGPWDFNVNDLRYDVGPGLRYATPIGPLRVDFGYQLNPIPGLMIDGKPEPRRYRVHFSIGQAF
jgi:outer membrane protein insertion porin family/translocation and assembly module TamA